MGWKVRRSSSELKSERPLGERSERIWGRVLCSSVSHARDSHRIHARTADLLPYLPLSCFDDCLKDNDGIKLFGSYLNNESPCILRSVAPTDIRDGAGLVRLRHTRVYLICIQEHSQRNKDERTQFFRKIYRSLYSKGLQKGYESFMCERWVGDWTKTATYWPPALPVIAAFLSRSPGLLNRGPGAGT